MRVDALTVRDIRNVEQAEITFDPLLTILCGKNGQGKTNLLESIWMLTGGKSFRLAQDSQLLRAGAQETFGTIEGVTQGSGHENHIRVLIDKKGQKGKVRTLRINGAECRNSYEAAGVFTAVVFEPNMMNLIKGGPAERRRFLDAAVSQASPSYSRTMREYYTMLGHKNALLKTYRRKNRQDETLMDVYDEALSRTGALIRKQRLRMLELILPEAQRTYGDIAGGKEALTYQYSRDLLTAEEWEAEQRTGTVKLMRDTLNHSQTELYTLLQKNLEHDLKAGYCSAGPHRDDFWLYIDGKIARLYASQGQQRSAVLALKLGEAQALAHETGEHPVMLLDDVLSELDTDRQAYLLSRVAGRQTVLTSCTGELAHQTGGKVLHVEQGKVWE